MDEVEQSWESRAPRGDRNDGDWESNPVCASCRRADGDWALNPVYASCRRAEALGYARRSPPARAIPE